MTLESRLAQLSESKRALLAQMIGQRTQPAQEPIAVVGVACRFPGGANDPASFWRLLRDGRDVVTEIPRDRWDIDEHYDPDPDAPGKLYTRWGGFLEAIDQFDAGLFGISQAEADAMDPQQRVLLEVAWEALENAGLPPMGLQGSRTGVYMGLFQSAYADLRARSSNLATVDEVAINGVSSCMAVGRLSYLLGLHGPSVPVNTACSSSLVALHLACQALRSGECELALAGGVNVMLSLEWMVSICRTRAMSPDGRCKTFDAAANGMVEAEGCGVVVLKRLSDAQAAGDHILALIRGSAVNHDGRSASLIAPNGKAQQAVLRQALAAAGVSPGDVGHLEAHGTGTPLGDPIEVEAAAAVLSEGRRAGDRAWLTSVKTNIGHSEAAAGIASLIKVILSLQHEAIPPHLHFKSINPHISLERSPFAIPTQLQPWPRSDRPRMAGVSSFGASGTNAHVVLEEAPGRPEPARIQGRTRNLVCLSAQTEEGLRQLAGRYRAHLARAAGEGPAVVLGDLAFTANTGRSHLRERLAVVAGSTAELDSRLGAFLSGEAAPLSARARASSSRPKLAFLFPGQSVQYSGMGQKLYQAEPVFRRTLDACAQALGGTLERPLLDVMFGVGGVPKGLHNQSAYAQPLVFSFECALHELWKSWGVVPDVVIGHSLGELAASYAAGILPLDEGARLAAERGRLAQSAPGETYSVAAGYAQVEEAIRDLGSTVGVAAINTESDTVLSGTGPGLEEARARLERAGVEVCKLNIPGAAHSPSMDPILDALEQAAAKVHFGQATIPLISNLTGAEVQTIDARYVRRHLREPVRFLDGLRAILQRGVEVLLEVSPHPVLAGLAAQVATAGQAFAVPSLRRGEDEWETLLSAAGALHARGVEIDFKAMDGPFQPRLAPVPTYPFQRQRYWMREAPAAIPFARAAPGVHPVLHRSILTARGEAFLEGELSSEQERPFLDHQLRGMPLLPGAATFGLMLAAASTVAGEGPWALSAAELDSAVPLGNGLRLQLSLGPESGGARRVELHACTAGDTAAAARWWKVASCQLRRAGPPEVERPPQGAGEPTAVLNAEACYRLLGESGMEYGSSFRLLEQVRLGGGSAVAQVRSAPQSPGWWFPPQVADACFQALAVLQNRLLSGGPDEGQACVPVGAEHVFLAPGAPAGPLRCEVSFRQPFTGPEAVGDVRALDASGRVVLQVTGLSVKRVGAGARRSPASFLYGLKWTPQEPAAAAPEQLQGTWVLMADSGGEVAGAVQGRLRTAGARCVLVARGGAGPGARRMDADRFEVSDPEGVSEVLQALSSEGAPARGIVHLWPLDEPGGPAGAERLTCDLASLVRGAASAGQQRPPRLYLVTRGAQSLGGGVEEGAVAQATLWGASSVLALEHPELWGGCVDLGSGERSEQSAAAVEAALGSTTEDLHASRRGERHALRLVRMGFDAGALELGPQGTYLVTGGLGTLGLRVARWLVDRGARHLVLLGRSAPGAAAAAQLDTLRAAGAEVQVVQADVAREDQLADALEATLRGPHPLRGVVHAAVVLADAPILRQTEEGLRAAIGPKVRGAWNLHRLTRGLPLDFFVLFSSASAVMGVHGQMGYAAANAALDALAHHRRSVGLPALSVNWGPWADEAAGAQAAKQASRWGVGGLDPEGCFEALGALIARGPAQAVAMQVDWAAVAERFERGRAPLYAALAPASQKPKQEEASAGALLERLQKLPSRERLRVLQDELRALIARALNLPELESVAAERLLVEAGVDSLRAVQARNALGKYFARVFPSKLLFDCPTVKALSQYLVKEDPGLRELFQEQEKGEAVAPTPAPEDPSQGLLAKLAQLSDEEAESLAAQLATSTDR